MNNFEIAKVLYEIADYLEADEVAFKPQAYRRAGRYLESLSDEVSELYYKGGIKALMDLPEIGKGIAKKIVELIKTGQLKYYQRLKKALPVDMVELTSIEGIGPKTVKKLYKELKIKSVYDLEKAARAGLIQKLHGFQKKSEDKILKGIEFFKKNRGRFLLGEILPVANSIIERLEKRNEIKKAVVAGSIRRYEETVGDIDLLAVSDQPEKVMQFFCSMPEVSHIYDYGPTKSMVRFKMGIDVDLRVVDEKSFGASWQYFTGNKYHSIETRKLAQKKNLKLNEYGVFRGRKRVAGRTEKEVYRAIGLPYIEPEIRLNCGEIKAAQENRLPKLIGYNDIKGDLHIHTTWSEGMHTIEQMAHAAKKMGYEYIVITDHTQYLKITHGMDEKALLKQMKEIDKINKKLRGITVLKGAEINILKDGSLDIKNEILKKLDVVLVAVHSHFKMSKPEMTKRVIKAISNTYTNILAHPTGRIIQQRDGYEIDLDLVFKAAVKNKVALEINAFYNRLDLKDTDARRAVEKGVKLAISTDAHQASHLDMMELGVATARRGWVEKSDVINTSGIKELYRFLEK